MKTISREKEYNAIVKPINELLEIATVEKAQKCTVQVSHVDNFCNIN